MFKHCPDPSRWVGIGQPCILSGLHQPASAEVCAIRQAVMENALKGERSFSEITLNDYQMWAALNWKAPHYTRAAAERAVRKLHEEVVEELVPALSKRMSEFPEERPASEDDESVGELGDVLWCVSSLATLDAIDLQRAAAHYLLDEIGTANLTVNLGGIDKLFQEGFRPRLTRTLFNDEDSDFLELEPSACLTSLCITIQASSRRRIAQSEERGYELLSALPAWAEDLGSIGQTYGQFVIFLAYYAYRWAGSSLSDTVRRNVEKLSLRIRSGHIDKADGQRAEEER